MNTNSTSYKISGCLCRVIQLTRNDKNRFIFVYFHSGTSNISINFNEQLILNAGDFSFDPDIDPSDHQGIAFQWFCKQRDEVRREIIRR